MNNCIRRDRCNERRALIHPAIQSLSVRALVQMQETGSLMQGLIQAGALQ